MSRLKRAERRGAKKPPDTRPFIRDARRPFEGPAEKAVVNVTMVLLALAVGFVVGFLVFLVMNLSTWLTELLWKGVGESLGVAWFPLLVCTLGGLIIGLWTHYSGSRVEPLEKVMSTFRATGSYDLNGTGRATISFLLPLVFGGSIGFEAGLTGLITAGCCWIRDKLKAAGLREAAVADVTIAASISAIFATPLAGIVAGAESTRPDGNDQLAEADVNDYNMRRPAKIVLYTAAAFGAFAGIRALSALFGASAGFPRFDAISSEGAGYLWILLALAAAYLMALLYHASNTFTGQIASSLGNNMRGTVLGPVIAGVVLGLMATFFPYVLFPGEVQSHELMQSWTSWTAAALIATGTLKALATPMCINLGWVGGNFCPSIFAGAACGYGLAMLTGADPMLMVTVVTSGFLAGVMRRPLLAIAILMLCFPLESIVWMGLSAIVLAALPLPSILKPGDKES